MSFVPDEIQSTIVEHVFLHGLTMGEVGLQAHLQVSVLLTHTI